jgi:hypothetical protein
MSDRDIERLREAREEIEAVINNFNRGVEETDYEKTDTGIHFEKEVNEAIRKLKLAEVIYENNETITAEKR